MPHVPASVPPADPSEGGGRHGRPGRHKGGSPLTIRARLLGLAVLPAAVVALCATCVFVLAGTRTGGQLGAPWALLIGAMVLTLLTLTGAAVGAHLVASGLAGRIVALRSATARGEGELHDLAEALRRGAPRAAQAAPAPVRKAAAPDELGRLAADLDRARAAAVAAVLRAVHRAPVTPSDAADTEDDAQAARGTGASGAPADRAGDTVHLAHTVAVSTHLARRIQALVHRGIAVLDELEKETEDPDLLKSLFQVDHLATRLRRHAENAAVLGGAPARRRWSRPVPLIEVLRSAMAEVEQYQRVVPVPPMEAAVRGHAVTDVAHVLAELIENATVFSAPGTPVMLRAAAVTAGLAIEVEDRGLGMAAHERARMNMLLTDAAGADVSKLLRSGRTGLYVVSRLARRHGISVRLQSNIYGGTQAVLVLPRALLGPEAPPATAQGGTPQLQATPAPSGSVPEGPAPVGAAQPGTAPARPTSAGPTPARAVPAARAEAGPVPGGRGGEGPAGHVATHAGPGGRSVDDAAREHTNEVTAQATATPPGGTRLDHAPHTGGTGPEQGQSAGPQHTSGPGPENGHSAGEHAHSAGPEYASGARPAPPASPSPAAPVCPPTATLPDVGECHGLPRRQAQQPLAQRSSSGTGARPAGERASGPNPELMAAFRRGSDLGAAAHRRAHGARPSTRPPGS